MITNKETALIKCNYRWKFLQECSKPLKADPDVVLTAIENGPKYFCYADHRLRADEGFVINCIKKNPGVFAYTSRKMKKNNQIIFEAVQADPKQWQFVDKRIQTHYGSYQDFLALYNGNYIKG